MFEFRLLPEARAERLRPNRPGPKSPEGSSSRLKKESKGMRERHTGAAALALVLTMTLAITACASSQQAVLPTDPDPAPAYLRIYAECWAAADSADAAQLRCRHLAPGAEHYLRRDEHGEAVYLTGGRFPVPRYDYTPEAHAACLEEMQEWIRKSYELPSAKSMNLFAESICAVPPPQYTNVED